jgi:hypothetical protein
MGRDGLVAAKCIRAELMPFFLSLIHTRKP